ncbi:hypothetical protein [Saccharothrix sp. NRRL B-16314]|nr:hypothetical protein [Saccharothrix sp. NRRL B-16314]
MITTKTATNNDNERRIGLCVRCSAKTGNGTVLCDRCHANY